MEQTARQERGGQLLAALVDAAESPGSNPALAQAKLGEILAAVPGQRQALLLLVCTHCLGADKAGARAALEGMAEASPDLAAVQYELGMLLTALGEHHPAIAALSRVVELEPEHPSAWRALGNVLARTGDRAAAGRAFARQLAVSLKELKLLEDAIGQADDALGPAENMLRESLRLNGTDACVTHMLACVLMRRGRSEEAERMFARALELAPAFATARRDYVSALDFGMRWTEIGPQLDILLKQAPRNPQLRALRANALLAIGEDDRSIAEYEALLTDCPKGEMYWVGYGNALRTVGRHDDAVAAYRTSIALHPGFGSGYRDLANLKTFRFSEEDVEEMRKQLARPDLSEKDRYRVHFSLGKALEDQGAHAESFENYRRGSSLRRASRRYDPEIMSSYVRTCRSLFTRKFFEARRSFGSTAAGPIFIVGLPRSGSTLVEQILASHPAIEGTGELQDITHIATRLDASSQAYPGILERLNAKQLRELGEEYLARTRIHRKLGRSFFTDKLPGNFKNIGLIHLILPNARIIDMRRHPLACGSAMYKHDFSRGMDFAYELSDIGRYYRDYVELMAHFDSVLSGCVHRVFYEDVVRDAEPEIRRLLDYCGLPFEAACLRFHETARSVRTVSSEQVRRPIYADALEQWRNYEPWLGPLKAALGPVLDLYPAVPDFRA